MELALFHPMDTVAKRLMNDSSSGDFKKIIFKDAAESNLLAKGRALLPGLGYAAVYKLSQRVYKFGSQPIIKEQLRERVCLFLICCIWLRVSISVSSGSLTYMRPVFK